MSRAIALFGALGLWMTAAITTSAQEATPEPSAPPTSSPSLQDEVHSLRRMIEQQSRQLDVLAREIAQLSQQIGSGDRKPAASFATPPPASAPAPASAAAAETPAPVSTPTPSAAAPSTAASGGAQPAATPAAEAAQAAGGGVKHTVAKGETLTSIAKHYNIPIAELQKYNKIQDERKLQIGQTLNIPTTQKPPETQTDKKENP